MIIHKGDENLTVKYTSPKITLFKTPMDACIRLTSLTYLNKRKYFLMLDRHILILISKYKAA